MVAMLDLIYSKFFISLKLLYVTQEVLEYFLSKGPDLERLTVVCGKSLVNFRVAGPSVALKYLLEFE